MTVVRSTAVDPGEKMIVSFYPKTQHFVQDQGAYEIFTAGRGDIPRIKIEYATLSLSKMIVFGSKLVSVRPKTQHFVQDRGAYEIFTAGIYTIFRG